MVKKNLRIFLENKIKKENLMVEDKKVVYCP